MPLIAPDQSSVLRPALWPNLIPVRPKVINFQVNDICNARCVMCFIWKNKRSRELSPAEFGAMLRAPFFSEVEHIGITGGEPTLRSDLAEFYLAALETLPGLKGGSFITNGFSPTRAIEIYGRVADIYSSAGVSFTGMVSIDGVGKTHDKVRGRSGAFSRATRTLFALLDKKIETIACCTIVRENVYGLHELLEWGTRNGVYIRFRVGEFINRLYNESADDQIQAFDEQHIKHLVAFFHLLLAEYETAEPIRRTYSSILSRLTGGPRLVKCPYQSSQALNIDSQGRFAHCAPKGTPHRLGPRPRLSLLRHAPERMRILQSHCETCIHDYHADWLPDFADARRRDEAVASYLFDGDLQLEEIDERPAEPFDVTAHRSILLIGWYGSETAGDIAILGGVISEYLSLNPSLRLTLLSLYPSYTKMTMRDLGAAQADRIEVVAYRSTKAADAIASHDAVVMAGGPLMDIQETKLIASIFKAFAERRKPCVIEGCGIGPLTQDVFRRNVIAAARLASTIRVRDEDSRDRLRSFGLRKEITVRADPASRFVMDTGIKPAPSRDKIIRCFLRQLTWEYRQEITPEACEAILSTCLMKLLAWFPEHRIELLPMHYFPIGYDDRVFARRLAGKINNPRLFAVHEPLSPTQILQAMAAAEFCLCMRYHSVVFAYELGVPFVALDYTNGGKILGFLKDRHLTSKCLSFRDLDGLSRESLQQALAETV